MSSPGTGTFNGVLIKKNISLDYTNASPGTVAANPIFQADGDLMIGSILNPNIAALRGRITSPGGTVTIGYTSPNITLEVASVVAPVTITGDTGLPITSATFAFHGGTTGLSFNGAGTTFTTTFAGITANAGIVNLGTDNTNFAINIGTSGTRGISIGNNTSTTSLLFIAGSNGLVFRSTGGIAIGQLMTNGTLTIGNNTMTGNINIADSSSSQTLNLGPNGGSGSGIVNISTTSGANQTVHIADGTVSNTVTLGSFTGTSTTTLNSGSGGLITTGVVGVTTGSPLITTVDSVTGQLGSQAVPTQFTWSVITVNQTAAVNNGYICNKAGTLALALPATSAVGDIIEITGINTALGWQITQAGGQQIFLGALFTTLGATGTVTSSDTRDAIRILCIATNTTWQMLSLVGNPTVF